MLEDYDHARARGARIHAELVGYGVASDGADMVALVWRGRRALHAHGTAAVRGPIDYLNTHGTATPLGDLVELEAVRAAFGQCRRCPRPRR